MATPTLFLEFTDVPEWLTPALFYYKSLGEDLRLDLFNLAAKELEEPTRKLLSSILNLIHLGTTIGEDITNEAKIRWGEKPIHEVHGVHKASVWALGINHYTYKALADNFSPDELAFKYVQLYNDLGVRLVGDRTPFDGSALLYEFHDRFKKSYREVVRGKISCYVASFPLALFALARTADSRRAMALMEDDDLLEIGYLITCEKEFVDHFTYGNEDIRKRKWTILVDLLSRKITEFKYPEFKVSAHDMFKEHDIYNDYIKMRDASLQSLKYELLSMKMSQMKGIGLSELFEAKYNIIEYCLEYFETIKYKGTFEHEEKPKGK